MAAQFEAIADQIVKYLGSRTNHSAGEVACRAAIQHHWQSVVTWSSRIQILGMPKAADTEVGTIGLRISDLPRRFSRADAPAEIRSDVDLASDDRSYVLLGDPGSGKTTTLKRLARRLIDPDTLGVTRFPIVVRLRELPRYTNLFVTLAHTLGFSLTERVRTFTTDAGTNKKVVNQWLGDLPLDHAIAAFFNTVDTILLLDGLDEVGPIARRTMERDIAWLVCNSPRAKTIVTCRSGDYNVMLEGMDHVELCPLDARDVAMLGRCWLPDHHETFGTLMEAAPFREMAESPLVLAQLMMLYRRYGHLPQQPAQIYRRIIALMVEDWDAERAIRRPSRYSDFDTERKVSFLSALAYHLTVVQQQRSFSERDLLAAYEQLHARFHLPATEAKHVLAELEAHTGLFLNSGGTRFEFAHIALQEYLCAEYLVREPIAHSPSRLLDIAPTVVAIASALSSDPSTWVASLVLAAEGTSCSGANLRAFFGRLALERPHFRPSAALGVALLKVFTSHDDKVAAVLMSFLDDPNVATSVRAAIELYEPARNDNQRVGYVRLRRVRELDPHLELLTPTSLETSRDVLERIRRPTLG